MIKYYKSAPDILNFSFFVKLGLVAIILFIMTYYFFSVAMESVIHRREEVIVPDIKGKSSLSALRLISENNLALKISGFEFNDTVPVGTVLRQNPQAGMTVREDRIIRVTFSQGGESVFVPNVIGLPIRNAELLLRRRKLMLGEVTESYSLKAERRTILSQDPPAESSVAKNTMVNIVISAGQPPSSITLMPDFTQKKIEEVDEWAAENNFRIKVSEDPSSLFPYGTVLEQNPAGDTVVDEKTEFSFVMSGNKVDASGENEYGISYQISQGGSQRHIRIVAVGMEGDKEIFNGMREPGSKIELSVPRHGIEKIRIFVNGIMVEERRINQ